MPGQGDLCRAYTVLLCYVTDYGVFGNACFSRGSVRRQNDAVLLAQGEKLWLRLVRMTFDLVDCRNNFSGLE